MLKCIVFDMDDTLYDEIEYCKSGFRAVAEAIGDLVTSQQPPPEAEEFYNVLWSQFAAGNHKTTFNAVLEQFAIAYDDNLIAKLVETYRQHYPSITLPAESENVLKDLQTDYKLALLTDGYLPAQRLKAQALGIEKYFKCIIYTEELGREFWKPSPTGFEKITNELKVEGKDCAYISDNAAKDFIAPNKLGFETVQIIRKNAIHREPPLDEFAKPDLVIKSLDKLPALLKTL